jgi:hypothetical protein
MSFGFASSYDSFMKEKQFILTGSLAGLWRIATELSKDASSDDSRTAAAELGLFTRSTNLCRTARHYTNFVSCIV